MATNVNLLASEIATALGAPVTPEIIGFSQALLDEFTGNCTATMNDYPTPHTMSGMDESRLATNSAIAMGKAGQETDMTIKYCKGIIDHIQNDGIVTYASKPPSSTVPPGEEWMNDGTISGLDGSAMASEIESNVGAPFMSPKLIAKCSAICDHIMTNAEVEEGVIS